MIQELKLAFLKPCGPRRAQPDFALPRDRRGAALVRSSCPTNPEREERLLVIYSGFFSMKRPGKTTPLPPPQNPSILLSSTNSLKVVA